MGWAGPAQPTGPDSAQKVLGRFRPKMDWADFGPNTIILFWARPGPEEGAGPGPTWPSDRRWRGGELFSPPPSCMQNVIRSACKGKKRNRCSNEGRKKNYLARRRRCLAASLAVLWWRPVAVSWLTDGGSKQRRYSFERRCYSLFSSFSTS